MRQLGQALLLRQKLFGPENSRLVYIHHNLGGAFFAIGSTLEAEEQLVDAVRIAENTFGQTHPVTCRNRFLLARIVTARGEVDRAADLMDAAIRGFVHTFGERNAECAKAVAGFSRLTAENNRPDLASKYAALAEQLRP